MKSPHHRSLGRTFLIALVAVTFLAAGVTSLSAQQAPPTWKQGQPDTLKDSQLAPVPQPPAPKAPGEIPVNKIKVPQGFKVELWASGMSNARAMALGSKGTMFVSSRPVGNVYALVDKGG